MSRTWEAVSNLLGIHRPARVGDPMRCRTGAPIQNGSVIKEILRKLLEMRMDGKALAPPVS